MQTRKLVEAKAAIEQASMTPDLPARKFKELAELLIAIEKDTASFERARKTIMVCNAKTVPGPQGDHSRVPDEKMGEVEEKIDKLLDAEIEFSGTPVKWPLMRDAKGRAIRPPLRVMAMSMPFIDYSVFDEEPTGA